jgi:pSer/pThr/pTyr-binding forkhead associated (FHA) protein
MAQVVLRFIAGPQQGKEYPLEPGRDVIIGRVPEVDLQIADETVSRKHASLSIRDGAIILQDLSRNGTFVNGKRITKVSLLLRDQIQIGNSILKLMEFGVIQAASVRLRPISSAITGHETILTAPSPPPRPAAPKPAPTGTRTTERFRGSLADIALVDLVQLLCGSRKSGILTLHSPYGVGEIHIQNGRICHARLNDADPDDPYKTFYRFFRWSEGVFDLQPLNGQPINTTLTGTTESLLLEAARLLDEINNLGPLPSFNAHLTLASPLPGPLHDLSTIDFNFIQLVLRHKTVQAVLDHYNGTDFQAYVYLMSLLARRFITVASTP